MKLKSLFLIAILGLFANLSWSQRYLTQIFPGVTKTTAIYGYNYTALKYFIPSLPDSLKHTQLSPLIMDVYQPTDDVATDRPLIIYLPTGNFFPFNGNGSCGGTIGDSSNVEFATRLAKMGYVVAVADYRKGWAPSPLVPELTRRFTLINAAYRGVQDVRTCIRFMRKDVATLGNTYGIDPNKIVVWGQGTGGYLSLATAFLNTYPEIFATADPNKFKIGGIPMVLEAYNGDVMGVQPTPGIVDATYAAGTGMKPGDTLYVPNHIGYQSNFNMAVNMGGALGDSAWMDQGEMPLISYHVPTDPFAPCLTNVLNVPTAAGAQPVVEVSGSCDLQPDAQAFGNNAVFGTIPNPATNDPLGAYVKSINGGLDGFYPFNNTPDNTSAPWEWASPNGPLPGTVCNYNANLAKVYIDSIIMYFAPRACVTLGLGCQFSSTNELTSEQVGLGIAPIPATNVIHFNTKDANMLDINVFDMNGRLVRANNGINATSFEMERGYLKAGFYFAEIRFEQGIVRKKLVIMD